MKSVLLFLVMSCMTISLCAQWKPGHPGEERLFKEVWHNPFSKDTTSAFFPGRYSKHYQEETYANLVRQNAFTHQLDTVIKLGPSSDGLHWIEKERYIYQFNTDEKLSAVTSQFFNEVLHTWEYGYRISYDYNDDHKVTRQLTSTWNVYSGSWIEKDKIEYEYDHLMRLIHETAYYPWNEALNSWDGFSKVSFTYYNQSNQVEIETNYNWNSIDLWIEASKNEIFYSPERKMTEMLLSRKSSLDAEWIYTDRTVFEHDTAGQLIFITYSSYLDNGNWKADGRYHYAYDTNGNVAEELSQFWDEGVNNWQPSSLAQYTFDGQGNELSFTWFNWDDITLTWQGLYRATTVYNEYGDYTEVIYQAWEKDIMEWIIRTKIEYEYDLSVLRDNILLPGLNEVQDPTNKRMPTGSRITNYEDVWGSLQLSILRYSIRTSALSLTIEPLTMSPNPAQDFIQFSIPDTQEGSTLNVYSPDGKLMISTNIIENTQVSTSSLSPGWYIARIQNGKDLYLGRFVKE